MPAPCCSQTLPISGGSPSPCVAAWEVPHWKAMHAGKISRSFSWICFFFFFNWEGHSFSEFSPSIPGRLSSNPGTRKDTRSGWYWLLARSLDSHVSYSAFLLWSQGRPAMLLKGSQKENAGICCGTQRALGKTTKP